MKKVDVGSTNSRRVYSRGHQRGARGHQVTWTDHVAELNMDLDFNPADL